MRILLAEDDPRISKTVAAALASVGFVVDAERDGEEIWFRGDTEDYDAIVLDLGLPSTDGLSILKRWRRAGRSMPVIILTARGSWEERVEGIDAGADDYLTKPFRIEELVARIRALVRRASGNPAPVIEVGELALDTRQMRVSRSGQPIALSALEYRLVAYLLHHRGRIVDRIELTQHLYEQDSELESNVVEVLVNRVRKKIGSDVIETRRGFGYLVKGPES